MTATKNSGEFAAFPSPGAAKTEQRAASPAALASDSPSFEAGVRDGWNVRLIAWDVAFAVRLRDTPSLDRAAYREGYICGKAQAEAPR